MSRAQNRHDTAKWKARRRHKHGGNAKCTICHSSKVIGLPTRRELRHQLKDEIASANEFYNYVVSEVGISMARLYGFHPIQKVS